MTYPSTQYSEISERLMYFDFSKGLERFAGNEDTYIRILRFYSLIISALIETIKELRYENLPELADKLLGIKQACRSICAQDIENRAEALEKAARNKNTGFINIYCNSLLEDAWNLVFEINETLYKMRLTNTERGKPVQDCIN